jgi:glycosyltransferase involved in cell wall biosynthesis
MHPRRDRGVKKAPAASVVIPAYRASREIPDALASVFGQTVTDFEVIVVNDGSTDTVQLEAALTPFARRLRYIAQPNLGAAAARNAGIRQSTGRYVAFLDADDVWAPDFLRRQLTYLEAHPACALVYADATITGDSPLAGHRFMEHAPSRGEVTLTRLIRQQCNVPLSTVVVRRTELCASGLFDESLRRGQDFDLWLRLALRGAGMAYQPMVLAERRVHADGLSGDRCGELERALTVLTRFGSRADLTEPVRAVVRARTSELRNALEIQRARQQLLDGRFEAARRHLEAATALPVKQCAALLALRVAPRAFRRIYCALHPRPCATVS